MSVTQSPSLRLFFTLLLHSHRHPLRASVAQSGELPMGSCVCAGLCGVPAMWEMISPEVLHEQEGPAGVYHELHGKAGSWGAFGKTFERGLCGDVVIDQCCDLSTAGENVGAASHPQDRRWKQLWCFYSGKAPLALSCWGRQLLWGRGSRVPLNLSFDGIQQLQSWGWFRF